MNRKIHNKNKFNNINSKFKYHNLINHQIR